MLDDYLEVINYNTCIRQFCKYFQLFPELLPEATFFRTPKHMLAY